MESTTYTSIKPRKLNFSVQESILDRYQKDWKLWIEDWLHIPCTPWPNDYPPPDWDYSKKGYPLTTDQVAIIDALQKYKKVAVKSSFAIGKTFLGGVIAITICAVEHAMGITTAPNFRQIKKQLWGEIHKIYDRAEAINKNLNKTIGANLNKTSLDFDEGKWNVEGFSTDKSYNFQGFHETKFFLIVDEACQVDRETMEKFDDILTNEDVWVLFIGNPINPNTKFRELFEDPKFYHMQIDSFMSPNVKHQKNLFPFLVSKDWPAEKLNKCKGDVNHPIYRSSVLAEFPIEGEDQLISWDLIKRAQENNFSDDSSIITVGLDVSRMGEDLTEFGYRRANGKFRIYRETSKERETETAGRAILDLKGKGELPLKEDGDLPCFNIDDIGVGGGVSDILFEGDWPINEITVSEAPEDWREDYEIFLNKRSYFYWQLRKAFEDNKVDIDPDDYELAEELHALQKGYTSGGKIKIQSKDEIREALGRSPNRADCMMLAFSEDEAENTKALVRAVG